MKKIIMLIVFGSLLLRPAYAAVPHTFSNNTVADATEVNDNFNYFENKFSTTAGHNHDGVNSRAITSFGTVTTGVWHGTIIDAQYGGTGNNLVASPQGSIIYAQSTGDFVTLSPGTSGQVLTTNGTYANPSWGALASSQLPTGTVVQVVSNISDSTFGPSANLAWGAVATGTGVIDTTHLPQNTEGDQYMQITITPTSATNKLKIDVTGVFALDAGGDFTCVALFKDSTANALAAVVSDYGISANYPRPVNFTHFMTAGTTSAITFKVRAGSTSTHTTTFNGHSSTVKCGGVMASEMTVTEIKQ